MNELDAALEPVSSAVCGMFDGWPSHGTLVVLASRADVRQALMQFWFSAQQRDKFSAAARQAGWNIHWQAYETGWDIVAWEELHE